ncbi:hypothetical protein BHS09_22090 [Myxococcus xanthus]|uniref:Uncharacterized protein n=1 Tax=Myxococcus xanthus TaxID=34 RepID=A0AAE6G218_MYXXA|nr:hypothetical protein [Myxococcus xanthus]QDE69453.1 hypothetical protein BHS09_22090 [Myxococcus xanthus]QDE76730.1 hypothetical protein BHS08_22105 [Myxococcus xanthus]
MPFLNLNGITVPVVEGRRRQVSIGVDSRSFSGVYRLGRRATRQEWEFKTGPLSSVEALAFRGLIAGDGHALAFDGDTFTSRGLASSIATGGIFQGARFGGGFELPIGVSCAWAMQLGPRWTTLHHLYDAAGGVWLQVINRSDGARWMQGTASASAGGLIVSSGSLSLTGALNLRRFDDVVSLPFMAPDSWVPEVALWHSARAWSALPYLTAGGAFCVGEAKVLGEVRDGEFVEFIHQGARVIGERLEFTLREV